MARRGTAQSPQHGVAGSLTPDALSSLLETERQLSDDIAHAAEKARVLTEAARAAVARMESALDRETAELVRALDESEGAATQAAIAAETRAAQDQVRRLGAVPDEVVTRLADAVLLDFLGIATIGTKESGTRADDAAKPGRERGT